MSLQDFYSSKPWREFRQAWVSERLANDGEILCARCGKPIMKGYDVILHHKIQLTEENYQDADIALNPDNVEPLHLRCHNEEHGKGWLWTGERQVYLVYGPPSAGKTSYVRSVAGAKDLIVDVDELYKAITTQRSQALLGIVLDLRNQLIEMVEHRWGKWQNAYIIGGYANTSERERLIERVGAVPILVMEGFEVLYQREKDRGRRMPELIDEWFRVYHRTGGDLPPRE